MEELEYNILGSKIKIKPGQGELLRAKKSVDLVNEEIETLRKSNANLKDIDVAVLVALKIAAKNLEVENDFKDTMIHLKGGVQDVLSFAGSSNK